MSPLSLLLRADHECSAIELRRPRALPMNTGSPQDVSLAALPLLVISVKPAVGGDADVANASTTVLVNRGDPFVCTPTVLESPVPDCAVCTPNSVFSEDVTFEAAAMSTDFRCSSVCVSNSFVAGVTRGDDAESRCWGAFVFLGVIWVACVVVFAFTGKLDTNAESGALGWVWGGGEGGVGGGSSLILASSM